jgi:hypothetical protein
MRADSRSAPRGNRSIYLLTSAEWRIGLTTGAVSFLFELDVLRGPVVEHAVFTAVGRFASSLMRSGHGRNDTG